ncbi:hypothetical protein BUALT_Bualt18G0023900 [Buddleja alternifolia]|uniref:Uncharacterized protein n=1 Tax=Buddleja alternifolia TaxID=168488 RepID=A0AAV6WBC2_9LAMI|nr:hypothetical protein BUALT_Bualt18G0023900 [Buddleja alternifolia]
MFDILFGWRKASKCKKLIKRVQCRLKLLKNKRCCIVKQLRDDIAQLLKYGLHQTAFQRVDQLIKDQNIVQVYELLDQFCEFIIISLPYIRKHKDCPNDINEAASTLVFSSARFGDLPELLCIRKLFGERYGQRFVMAALELLPGNLVDHQIKEKLYMKKLSDDDKYRLLDEIASSYIEPGLLLLEYKPELLEEQATKSDVQIHNDNEASELQHYNVTKAEGKIIHMDSPRDNEQILKEQSHGLGKEPVFPNAIQTSDPVEGVKLVKAADCIEMDKFTIVGYKSLQCEGITEESSSETSPQQPEELIYLDDIEEFVSPVAKDGNIQDQRLFVFKSFGIPSKEKTDYGIDQNKLSHVKSVSRSLRKTEKTSRKRLRRRSSSQEYRILTDTECAAYYGASDETSPDNKRKSYGHRRDRRNKSSDFVKVRSTKGRDNEEKCSIENPCFCIRGEENQPAYLRAMTMPNERPNESCIDNIFRSNSYPFEQPHVNGYSSCRHIHPKLPDYDELAAKFMELKKANLENKQRSS